MLRPGFETKRLTQIWKSHGSLGLDILVTNCVQARWAVAFSSTGKGARAVSPAVRLLATGIRAIMGRNVCSGRYPRKVPWVL